MYMYLRDLFRHDVATTLYSGLSVSCETRGQIPPGEIKCETGRNSGEIADLHHFCSK